MKKQEPSVSSYMCSLQDVENYDPILNPVLNRELRRTGGRVLITLGDQDIDLSPSFVIFLSTRDPTVEFPPDICSRVTFVNFTVTRSSLQSQCLNQVLKAERPDIDEKRSDLLKLQGMYYQYFNVGFHQHATVVRSGMFKSSIKS
jgi:dynein heavy chain 1